jgi:tetratricopeptide (TPR) repeat protein
MEPKLIVQSLIVTLSLCLAGCLGLHPTTCPQPELAPKDRLPQAKLLLERKEPGEAMAILLKMAEKEPRNKDVYYLSGYACGLLGDMEKAISFYQKALTIDSGYHAAYLALKNIYQSEKLAWRTHIDLLNAHKEEELHKSDGDFQEIEKSFQEEQRNQAHIFLSQAKTYLLYYDLTANIAEFPDIDAHLRDIQDSLQSKKKTAGKTQKEAADPLIAEIQEIRRAITKKNAHTLFSQGVRLASQKNIIGAVEGLKDADDQLNKFFGDEKDNSKFAYLEADAEVIALAQNVANHLIQYYQESLQVVVKNRSKFIELKNIEDAEKQSHRIEEILEGWIQLQIAFMWRQEQRKRENAEEQDKMVPLYEKFLQYLPDSSKVGEYYYLLARCYFQQGRYADAELYAQKAQQTLGVYKVREFLEKLEQKKTPKKENK